VQAMSRAIRGSRRYNESVMADENAPATRKDLRELEQRMSGQMRELEGRMTGRMRELKDRLSEQMRDMQAELLKAFLPWQDNVRIQFRELEANTGNSVTSIKLRMDVMERRLGEIEKKLLLNPPAA
jgi:hypothetical protein